MYHAPLAVQYIYKDAVMKEVKMGMGRREVSFMEDGERVEIAWPFIGR